MSDLLYLVHRVPYPPDKGDKVRSFHLLKHLRARHRVFLGTFVDDPADDVHLDTLRPLCEELFATRLRPGAGKLRSLAGLVRREPLTLGYYRDRALAHWVLGTLARQNISAVVVFSSSMAQYVRHVRHIPVLIDFVDVDSAKWSQYAKARSWPLSWLYRREGELLLEYERFVARNARRSFFVTESEAALFRGLAPECAETTESMGNGVDVDYFCPDPGRRSPFHPSEVPIVFTGAMDYWPNVDAVAWFVDAVLRRLEGRWPRLRFYIVGRNPASAVRALASERVVVTGTVDDVRPFLQYAAAVVAPLRVARGIQNKVLEAMAMMRPVVASRQCGEAISARAGSELLHASGEDDFVAGLEALLASPERAAAIGSAARARIVESYSWPYHLAGIDRHLLGATACGRAA